MILAKERRLLVYYHMLVLAEQHIYECRNKCTYPSFWKRNLRIQIISCRSGKYMGNVSVILPW